MTEALWWLMPLLNAPALVLALLACLTARSVVQLVPEHEAAFWSSAHAPGWRFDSFVTLLDLLTHVSHLRKVVATACGVDGPPVADPLEPVGPLASLFLGVTECDLAGLAGPRHRPVLAFVSGKVLMACCCLALMCWRPTSYHWPRHALNLAGRVVRMTFFIMDTVLQPALGRKSNWEAWVASDMADMKHASMLVLAPRFTLWHTAIVHLNLSVLLAPVPARWTGAAELAGLLNVTIGIVPIFMRNLPGNPHVERAAGALCRAVLESLDVALSAHLLPVCAPMVLQALLTWLTVFAGVVTPACLVAWVEYRAKRAYMQELERCAGAAGADRGTAVPLGTPFGWRSLGVLVTVARALWPVALLVVGELLFVLTSVAGK